MPQNILLASKIPISSQRERKKSKAQCWKKQSLENLVLFDNLQIRKKLFFVVNFVVFALKHRLIQRLERL